MIVWIILIELKLTMILIIYDGVIIFKINRILVKELLIHQDLKIYHIVTHVKNGNIRKHIMGKI